MQRYSEIPRPGLMTRALYAIGRRMFGRVPTPELIMARRLPLLAGIGGLYASIRWLGVIDAGLRSLLNVHVATRAGSMY